MALYFFNLKDGRQLLADPQGVELADLAAAVLEGESIARELMRNREKRSRSWRLQVCDSHHVPLLEILFARIDPTLNHLSGDIRDSVHDLYLKNGGLIDSIQDVTRSLLALRGTLARADNRPSLATLDGSRI